MCRRIERPRSQSVSAITSTLVGRRKLPPTRPRENEELHVIPLLLPSEHGLPFSMTLESFRADGRMAHDSAGLVRQPSRGGVSGDDAPSVAPPMEASPSEPVLELVYVLSGEGSCSSSGQARRDVRAGDSVLAWANTTELSCLGGEDLGVADSGGESVTGAVAGGSGGLGVRDQQAVRHHRLSALKFFLPLSLVQLGTASSPDRRQYPSGLHLGFDRGLPLHEGGVSSFLSQEECREIMSHVHVMAGDAESRMISTRGSVKHLGGMHDAQIQARAFLSGQRHPDAHTDTVMDSEGEGSQGGSQPLGGSVLMQRAMEDFEAYRFPPPQTNTLAFFFDPSGIPMRGLLPMALHSCMGCRNCLVVICWHCIDIQIRCQSPLFGSVFRPDEAVVHFCPSHLCLCHCIPPTHTHILEIGLSLSFGVEVFEPGHRTPIHVHLGAHELFFVLAGESWPSQITLPFSMKSCT